MTTLEEPIDISQTNRGVEAVSLPFDFSKEDKTWLKYKISTAPLLTLAADGTLYDDAKSKGIFKYRFDSKVGREIREYKKIANRAYVVFPNEECDMVVDKLVDSIPGLKLHKTHTAYNGDAKYWELRADKKYTVGPNDEVQLGIVVRNSLACNVSFGADIFTFRLVCQNGAISKGKDLLSLKIPHYGKGALTLMHEALERRIQDLIFEGEELIKQYKIARRIKLRQEAAELLVKKVSHKYLPEYIEYDSKTRKTTLKQHAPWWKVFNDVTQEVWHNNTLGFLTKADITNVMHSVMKNEIAVLAK